MGRPRKIVEQAPSDLPVSPASEMARRIWAGQSVSLSVKERKRRIEAALAGHGFTAEEIANITLPA